MKSRGRRRKTMAVTLDPTASSRCSTGPISRPLTPVTCQVEEHCVFAEGHRQSHELPAILFGRADDLYKVAGCLQCGADPFGDRAGTARLRSEQVDVFCGAVGKVMGGESIPACQGEPVLPGDLESYPGDLRLERVNAHGRYA